MIILLACAILLAAMLATVAVAICNQHVPFWGDFLDALAAPWRWLSPKRRV